MKSLHVIPTKPSAVLFLTGVNPSSLESMDSDLTVEVGVLPHPPGGQRPKMNYTEMFAHTEMFIYY